jgi:hypothetical protein
MGRARRTQWKHYNFIENSGGKLEGKCLIGILIFDNNIQSHLRAGGWKYGPDSWGSE